jgi:uncharacterized membrane protein (DUF485 family)
MTQALASKIKKHPKYQELTSKRSSYAWTLSILMLLVYYAFIMTIAFSPETLGTPISEGSVISIVMSGKKEV